MILNVCIGKEQWSWESAFVPAAGDEVNLWVAEPGHEADDAITVTVLKRKMYVPQGDDEAEPEVDLIVAPHEVVPEGMVADSPLFPSREWHERKREFEAALAKIRRQDAEVVG